MGCDARNSLALATVVYGLCGTWASTKGGKIRSGVVRRPWRGIRRYEGLI